VISIPSLALKQKSNNRSFILYIIWRFINKKNKKRIFNFHRRLFFNEYLCSNDVHIREN